jgi:hypothetical protein
VALVAAGAVWAVAGRDGDGPAPLGEVAFPSGTSSPHDFGEAVAVVVAHTDPAPAPGRITVEPRTGDRPAAGARPGTATIAAGRQELTFSVDDTAAGRPTVVDRVVVRTESADGATREEVSVPVRLTFALAVPGPERCTAYDPAQVTVASADGSGVRVVSGAVTIATVGDRPSGEAVAGVARGADAVCLLGAPDAGQPPAQYWRRGGRLAGSSGTASRPVTGGCDPYDPASVRAGPRPGEVLAGRNLTLVILSSSADVAQAVQLARHYHRLCVIGRQARDVTDIDHPTATFWE